MKYAIAFKSGDGRTERSEYLAFETDGEAVEYGRRSAALSAIVEVWKGDNLLTRLPSVPGPAS